MRQVTGIDRGGGLSAVEFDADGDFVFRHHCLSLFFGVACGAAAVFGNQYVVEIHFEDVGVQIGNACVTDGGEQSAEVGVGGEEGGFDQRRVGDGVGDLAGFIAGFGVFDADGDEFGRAFAVADDGLGELEGEAAEQVFELFVARVGDVVDFALAVFAGGDDDEAVVGAGVAVNGDGVEGFVGDFLGHQLEDGLGNFGIGGDEGEHGRHVGMDHAGAFGDAGGADGMFFADAAFARGGFGHGVGGHDGACCIRPVGGLHFGQGGDDFADGQRLEDDACGEGKDLGGFAAGLFGGRGAGFDGVDSALCACAGVGVAGVDDDGAHAVFVEEV